ncbi:hypothetical protein OA77_10740 [Pseudomonas coronafaciens]|nr:hypothetical protein OA77_10740 [Pseudomonas coronafaciens]
MENHFKFLTLPKTSGEVANVFIHGYSSGHDLDDRRMLANSIPGALRQSVNILAFWPSSHFTQMDNRSRGLLMAAARVHPLACAAALAGTVSCISRVSATAPGTWVKCCWRNSIATCSNIIRASSAST